jgi:3-oxoacyl-[acyl-carrier protein] reductase
VKLEGRVAVVTGAGSGMGRATALLFAEEGADVVALDIKGDMAERTIADIGRGLALACDVADRAQVDEAFARVDEHYGRVDVLANIAGINPAPDDATDKLYEGMLARIEQMRAGEKPTAPTDQLVHMSDEGWHRMIDVHLNGTFYCTRAALRIMTRTGTAGAIVNTASIAALAGISQSHYCAAKGGILAFTKGLAREVAPRGIRVNAVCPGVIDTPMNEGIPPAIMAGLDAAIPLGRAGRPREAASVFLFLACDDSSYLTGQWISPNGGLVIA